MMMAFLLQGCIMHNDKKTAYKTKLVDYGTFTMQVPLTWKPLTVEYEDSAVGNIQIDEHTFIIFDCGRYSNPLNEDDFDDYYTISDKKVYLVDKSSTPNNRKYNYFGKADSTTLEKVRRSKIEWISLDNYNAKLLVPKKPGAGITGVYIDSLWDDNGGKIKFVMSSSTLTTTQQNQLLTAFKTLKFYHQPTALKN